MSGPHVYVAVRCNWCTRQYPAPLVHRLVSNQVICETCLDWHQHALDFLGGAAPRGCQECGDSWDRLREITPGVEVRMYVVPKDGIYQLLCRRCVKPYLPKQKQLFQGTQFGRDALKL